MAKAQTTDPIQFPIDQATQERSAAALTEVAEVLTSTATAIWEKQFDLLRVEVELAQKRVSALTAGDSPSAAIEAYVAGVQGSVETALTEMRDINDLMRDCAWRLFDLYAKQLTPGAASVAERPHA